MAGAVQHIHTSRTSFNGCDAPRLRRDAAAGMDIA